MKPWPLAALLLAAVPVPARAADGPQLLPDQVYGHKDGLALTLDVIKPAKPSGAGVLWLQSGGWYSRWVDPKGWPAVTKAFTDKGMAVFIVRHGSAPKYTVPEAVADVRRSVRFIKSRAKEYGVDPNRLGVTGSSAGGHLSLVLGTTGDDGDPAAADVVLRHGSRVAAVVAIYPPTDLRGWTTDPPPVIRARPDLRPPLTFDPKLEPDVSPLLKVTPDDAPTLLIHGDKDTLVPIEHSTKILAAFEAAKVPCKLVTIEGAGHGFTPQQNRETVSPALLAWFEQYLAAK